jgi:FlaA1/EpsC-like NDP-sugar epimerase
VKPAVDEIGAPPVSTSMRRDMPVWLWRHVKVLVLIDVVAATAATLISQFMAFGLQHADLSVRGATIPYPAAILAVVPTWLAVLATSRCYDVAPFGTSPGEVRRVIGAGTQFLALMAMAYYVVHLEQLGRDFMIAIVPLATGLTLAGRAGARVGLLIQRSRGHAVRRAVVMGPRNNSVRLLDHLAHHPASGIAPVAALVTDDEGALRVNGFEIPVVGRPEDALATIERTGGDLLIVTGSLAPGELRTLTWALEGTGVDVLVAPSVTHLASLIHVRPVAGLPLLYVDTEQVAMRNLTADRAESGQLVTGP